MLALEPVDLVQQALHAPENVGILDAIVLQVVQNGEDVHGDAVGAAGQTRVDLALVEFGRLEAIEVALLQPSPFGEAVFQRLHLLAAVTLHFEHPANSARMSSWRAAMRCCNSSGVTTISRRGSLLAVWSWESAAAAKKATWTPGGNCSGARSQR